MMVPIMIPRLVWADDFAQLREREYIARERRESAEAEMKSLAGAGYEVIEQYEHVGEFCISDVYMMGRKGDQTQLDPQEQMMVG